MSNRYILSIFAVLAIVEDAAGTYKEPTAAMPFTKEAGIWKIDFDKTDINPLSNYQGSKRTEINTDFATVPITAKTKLPTTITEITTLFKGCGLVGTTVDDVTTFRYSTNDASALSFKQVAKRQSTTVYGARGDLKLNCKVGEATELELNFKAQLKEVINLDPTADDNTIPDTPDLASVFMTKDCAAYLLNGNQAHFKEISLELNAEVITPKDTCAGACYTKDIKPELKVKMALSPNNENAFNDLKNGVEFNFVIPLFDAAGVKKWELIAPKCVVIEQDTPEDEGILNVDRTLECRRVNGDDNFELKYYA